MTTNKNANANTLPDRSIRAMAQKGGPKGDRLAGYVGPSTLPRMIEASLALSGPGVPFSAEIWCEPDPEGRPRSPLGYSYVAYNRRKRPPNDPVLALAYASGLIEAPAGDGGTHLLGANEAQAHPDDVDPETGEVIAPSDKSSLVG